MNEDLSKYNPEGSTLRKAQLRMLNILIEVDKICRKHNIDYFIDSGTLLGAVRHGGFIPWDDDLDICIKIEDLPRLKRVLKEELPSNLCYQDWTTDFNFAMPFSKVRDLNSNFDEPYYKRIKNRGLYIDIFYVEPSVPLWLRKPIDFVYIRCIRGVHNFSDRFIEKLLGYICYPPTMVVVWLCRLWAKIVRTPMLGRRYGMISPFYMHKDIVFPIREVQFEGHSFMAPNNIDEFLRILYGDYMQIPPVEKRITHKAPITFFDAEKE